MKIKIYQIGPETDRYDLMFMNLEFALKKSNGRINESTYELVYEGEVKVKNLEDLLKMLMVNIRECMALTLMLMSMY